MVGGRSFRPSAPALFALDRSRIDVGLHLDVTETPLRLPRQASLSRLILTTYSRRLDRRALRDEIEAQLDAFEDCAGRPPAYVDGHQHVHQFPQIRDELVAALARRYAAGLRPWLRGTQAPAGLWRCAALDWGTRIKPLVIESLGAHALERLANEHRFAQNAHLLGVYNFHPDPARYRQLLQAWLALAGDGDALMCHPALQATTTDPLLAARRSEMSVLEADDTIELIREAGLGLAPMSRMGDYPGAPSSAD